VHIHHLLLTCQWLTGRLQHTSEACPEPKGAVGKPKHPRLLSGYGPFDRAIRRRRAGAAARRSGIVPGHDGECKRRDGEEGAAQPQPAIPATAAIASRTDSSNVTRILNEWRAANW
jgi:hypothetical protein